MRVRFIYSKREGACFVPHIALAQVFSRSALRAGLKLTMTQGFSPRAKISFGPELPAGVVALAEPVDMYFADTNKEIKLSLPEGFCISRVILPSEDSPSIGKLCTHAEYFMRARCDLHELAGKFFGDEIVMIEKMREWVRFILKAPAQNPIGGLVKFLVSERAITGWHEINIVRASIGQFDEDKIYL